MSNEKTFRVGILLKGWIFSVLPCFFIVASCAQKSPLPKKTKRRILRCVALVGGFGARRCWYGPLGRTHQWQGVVVFGWIGSRKAPAKILTFGTPKWRWNLKRFQGTESGSIWYKWNLHFNSLSLLQMIFLFNRVNLRLFHRHQFSKVRSPLNLGKFLTEIVIWPKRRAHPKFSGFKGNPPPQKKNGH